jgi:hypothetical protein
MKKERYKIPTASAVVVVLETPIAGSQDSAVGPPMRVDDLLVEDFTTPDGEYSFAVKDVLHMGLGPTAW